METRRGLDLIFVVEDVAAGNGELVRKADGLFAAMSQGKGGQEVRGIVEFLDAFAALHFAREERYMAEYGYPDSRFHKEEHDRFAGSCSYLKNEVEANGVSAFLVLKAGRLLFDWITHHVVRADRAFCEFLKARADE